MDKIFACLLALMAFSQIRVLQGYDIVQPRMGKVCYKCTGIECTRSDFLNQTTTCTDIMDSCTTVFEGRSVVARGCYAEIPDEYKIRCESTSDCEMCTSLLCNEFAHPDIRCAQCSSTTNTNCLAQPDSITFSRCPFSSAYEPLCYVRYDGNSTVRGCFSSVSAEEECLQDNNCLVCAEKGCNTVEFPHGRRRCLTCSGQNCTTEHATSMYCNKLDDQCISMVVDGNIAKGCLSNVEELHRSTCASSNLCLKCNSNNCNMIDPYLGTGRAFAMKVSFGTMAIVLVVLGIF